jgi:hypothetical protein
MPAPKADTKIIDETHRVSDKRGNGREVGYDNQHGYHHRHYFGKISAVVFVSFEEIESQFEADWLALRSSV